MPPFYIGSTSVEKVNNGYKGSVKSASYKDIWHEELKNNPELFDIKIITIFDSRKKALEEENRLHKKLNVVKNPLYINKAIATGCFGLLDNKSINKMKKTFNSDQWKSTIGKVQRQKISATKNSPEWKSSKGEIARQKLIKTKNDPVWKETIGVQRNENNRKTVTNPEWINTIGKQKSLKISNSVKKTISDPVWKETVNIKRIEKLKQTMNDPVWKSTVGVELNKKKSESVSKTKSNPEWKKANYKTCEHCQKIIAPHLFKRYHSDNCKLINKYQEI